MALATAIVWFDLHQLLGADFDARRTKAYVTTNVENGTLMDTSTGEIRMGDQTVTINSDGTGEFATWVPGTDGNPTSWQTSLVVDYPRAGTRQRKTRVFGPYTIGPTVYNVTNKALTSNVATLTVDEPHGLRVGDTAYVELVDSTFNGSYTVTAVPSPTSFSYAKTATNVASVAATGTVGVIVRSLALLEEEQAVPAEYLTQVTAQLDAIRDDAEGFKDDAEAAAAATEANINGLTIGTVTTGAPGTSADVDLVGTAPARHFDFTIPTGATGATGPTGATGTQGPPGPGTGAGAWQATTAYTANQVVQAPDGSIIYRLSSGTSRSSFDGTEAALWGTVSSKSGTLENTALTASIEDVGTGLFNGKYTRIDVVADYGADPTGTTSAVTAINNAIAAANTAGGCEIYFPPGTYNVTAGGLTAITASNTFIVGAGRRLTTLSFQAGGLFKWTSSANGGGCHDLRFNCSSTPATDSLLLEVTTASRQTFKHLFADNAHCIFRGGYGTSYGCTQLNIFDVNGYTYNQNGSIAFDFVSGAVVTMRDVTVYANCSFPTDGTTAHPAATTIGARFGQGSWDTFVLNNVDLNRYNVDLDLYPGNFNVGNGWVTDCVFDYAKTYGIRIGISASGGGVRSVYFKGCWAVASDDTSVYVDGTNGVVKNVHFTDCVGRQAGKSNWRFLSSTLDGIQLLNCHSLGANRLSGSNTGNAQDDLVILGGGVSVRGGRFGEDGYPYTGIAGNQGRYGLTRAADIAVQIVDVELTGATGDIQAVTDTTADFRRVITRNRKPTNARPSYATNSGITAPTSAAVQTNLTGFLQTIYIYGGTMTQAQHNGVQVAAAGPATLVLQPGDTWQINYSVAPTVVRVIVP